MPSDKPRLYMVLYARDKPNEFHWALHVGPKKTVKDKDAGIRYHATNSMDPNYKRPGEASYDWRYQCKALGAMVITHLLLARIAIGKVENLAQLERTLETVPIRQDKGFTCRTWAIDAVRALDQDGSLGTRTTGDWDTIYNTALEYVASKRKVSRWATINATDWDNDLPATYDMMEGKEIIP